MKFCSSSCQYEEHMEMGSLEYIAKQVGTVNIQQCLYHLFFCFLIECFMLEICLNIFESEALWGSLMCFSFRAHSKSVRKYTS